MVVLTANRAGEPAPVDGAAAVDQLEETVSVYLDAGPCTPGPPSSIVDLTQPEPRILREGAIATAALLAVLPTLRSPDDAVAGTP